MSSVAAKTEKNKSFRQIWREKNMKCRIGTTSHIIPGEIISNLKFLKDIVENVEVVLFESDAFSNLPAKTDVLEMGIIAREAELTFTVHLPQNNFAGAANEGVRKKAVEKWLRIIDLMEDLSPFGWVVHLNDPTGSDPSWDRWQNQWSKTFEQLFARIEPDLLCIRTLNGGFDKIWSIVEAKSSSICLDIGHLQAIGQEIGACPDAWLDRSRIIHLHGVRDDGRENLDLGYLKTSLLDDLFDVLKANGDLSRILTLEVFSRKDLEKSMYVLNEVI